MDDQSEYRICCWECGKKTDLVVAPHRNKNNFVVGLFYVCKSCFESVSDKEISIHIIDRIGDGDYAKSESIL